MIEAWESEIITLLNDNLNDCAVKEYPEKPKNYLLKHKTGEILVRYDGTKYSQVDLSEAYQEREVTVELIFCYRRLRGNGGLYAQMENVRNLLYGHKLVNAYSGIQFDREELIGEDGQGVWEMGLKLKFKALFIPTRPALPTPPSSITVSTNSTGCQ